MTKEELYQEWKKEEEMAHIKGWDFSHIKDRYAEEDDLPWDFSQVIKKYLTDDLNLLDMETGGGEFLLSLKHPYHKTAAIEGYPPNVDYCKKLLLPLGIDLKEADGAAPLPFEDESFNVITNRHGDYTPSELHRLLKQDGYFITQQVGAKNDRELVELLLPELKDLPYSNHFLNIREKELIANGFDILESGEVYQPIRFFDIGALVWFAKIIEWEFVGFSVDKHFDNLLKAQEMIDRDGFVEGRIHRFYLVAKKK
ncbi:class I SAM-dependent methyltransferase [Streptococcus marimammalium]|uniref:class I SAM-dependent methyltransferase n=1 Tax=Streptococcus marimammalium TaxID=269666 RepID=UPI0003733AC2|nr:class I SAM-dependent methyltransferase [Streptococcus marimammalium]